MAHRRSKSIKEIRGLSVEELKNKIRDLEEHQFQLRMQLRTGQLASTAMIGLARREMARAKTILIEKQKAEAPAAKA